MPGQPFKRNYWQIKWGNAKRDALDAVETNKTPYDCPYLKNSFLYKVWLNTYYDYRDQLNIKPGQLY